jgi:ABC-type Mn2+/Zn2+ transport system permease subunit
MIEAVLLLLAFLVVVPSIAAAIAYAAWKGKPKNFGRDMYWTAFVAAAGAACLLLVCSQRMNADVRTWQYLIEIGLFSLGVVLFGVAAGCMIGILTYRRGVSAQTD